jgi:hypothetical protein
MRKFLKFSSAITLSIYVASYLIKTFVLWRFTNPLQWIIDIPNYSQDDRATILCFYIIYQALIALFTFTDTDKVK